MAISSYLADQLHVTVLDTVVHHLYVVTGTLVADPLAAGLAVGLCGDGLEDVLGGLLDVSGRVIAGSSYLDVGPGLLVTTGHDAGAVAGALLSSRDTGSDESDALCLEVVGAAVCVGVVRVTTVDDDVALLGTTLEEQLDEVIDGLSGHDEHHHAAGLLELGDELLDGVGADNRLALGLYFSVSALVAGVWRGRRTIVEETVNLGDAGCWSVCDVGQMGSKRLRSVESDDLCTS